MKVKQAVDHFGSQAKLARALDIDEALVSRWKADSGIIPVKHAMKLLHMADGELDLTASDYK